MCIETEYLPLCIETGYLPLCIETEYLPLCIETEYLPLCIETEYLPALIDEVRRGGEHIRHGHPVPPHAALRQVRQQRLLRPAVREHPDHPQPAPRHPPQHPRPHVPRRRAHFFPVVEVGNDRLACPAPKHKHTLVAPHTLTAVVTPRVCVWAGVQRLRSASGAQVRGGGVTATVRLCGAVALCVRPITA